MELVLIAVVALVILSGVDADLWPRPAPKAQPSRRTVRQTRRAPSRAAARRDRHAPRPALGYPRSAAQLCPAPRWWWE